VGLEPNSLYAEVAKIDVAIFPAEGDAVGVGDAIGVGVGVGVRVGVGDALALGDGVTLVTADDVVVAVVEDVELLVLTCGLGLVGEVDDVQPATKIVAITVATTSNHRPLFLMLFAQIALHTARI